MKEGKRLKKCVGLLAGVVLLEASVMCAAEAGEAPAKTGTLDRYNVVWDSPRNFNGSIFTVDKQPSASPDTEEGNPDWRCWGGPYWFQNTRLCYWPMLASGDFEMMEPWFRMYREPLPLSTARMEAIYQFKEAASFLETMHFWGMPDNKDYGWGHPGPEPQSRRKDVLNMLGN
jgi:hypothetical protein